VATLLLPLYARCDRWDVAGTSAVTHHDTGALTVFVHDGYPGGAGFAERAYEVVEGWLGAAWERVDRCPCATGCPACVISPACGSANRTLDKAAARMLLGLLVGPSATPVDPGRGGIMTA